MMDFTTEGAREKTLGRPSRVFSVRVSSPANAGLGPFGTWLAAVWFGLVAATLEATVGLVSQAIFNRVTLVSLRTNRHALWMMPVANLALFALVGLTLVPFAVRRSQRGSRVAFFIFAFLTALGVLFTLRRLHPVACLLLAVGFAFRSASPLLLLAQRHARAALGSLCVLILVVTSWCGIQFVRISGAERRALAALPAAAPGSPNIVLIVLDTVRADHLGFHGYGRDTTPQLDRIARNAVWFDEARATAPWTLPSHASLFTGRWHHEMEISAYKKLNTNHPMLAEFLQDHGYATAAFVANTFNCNSAYGFDRGFARYEDFHQNHRVSFLEALNSTELLRNFFQHAGLAYGLGLDPDYGRKDAATINRDALAWLARDHGRPFFVFLNYFDAHDPYVLPDGARPKFGPSAPTPEQSSFLRYWAWVDRRNLSPEQVNLARDAYDDGLAYLDDQIGRLFDELGRRKLLDNTLVIITSDHGEHLGEHRLFGHAKSLYRQEMHVPLVLSGLPRMPRGKKIAAPVSLRDVPATIFDLLGFLDQSPFPGASLARFWTPGAATEPRMSEPVLGETFQRTTVSRNLNRSPAMRGPMYSLCAGRYDYIVNGDRQEELYDFVNDPGEESNLAGDAQSSTVLERLRGALSRAVKAARAGSGTQSRGLASADVADGPR